MRHRWSRFRCRAERPCWTGGLHRCNVRPVKKIIFAAALSIAACNSSPDPAGAGPRTTAVPPGPSAAPDAALADSGAAETPPRPFAVLSSFETRYAYLGNRGKNIERAAIKSARLEPGQTFSFNAVVGPRTAENGFLKAPVILKGELSDGDGGGVCQVSSTLHGALRNAGLEIVSRTPHSRPSSYVQLGMDSTVVWPDVDLKVKNTLPCPVEIRMSVLPSKVPGERILRAEVWGSSDPVPAPSYRFSSRKKDPFSRLVRRPDGGAPDSVKRVQKGAAGQDVLSTIVWQGGRTETWRSSYPPTEEIWEVGEGAADDIGSWEPPQDAGAPDAGVRDASTD